MKKANNFDDTALAKFIKLYDAESRKLEKEQRKLTELDVEFKAAIEDLSRKIRLGSYEDDKIADFRYLVGRIFTAAIRNQNEQCELTLAPRAFPKTFLFYGSFKLSTTVFLCRDIAVHLLVQKASEISLTVGYAVTNVKWTPRYDFRVESPNCLEVCRT